MSMWFLWIKNSTHNHFSTLSCSHSALQKLAMINEILTEIINLSHSWIISKQILTILWYNDDSDNSTFKESDIYNVKTNLHWKTLESFTLIQALLQNLHCLEWSCKYLKNQQDHVTHLFFTKDSSEKLLKLNHEIFIINCIYC